MRRFFLAGLVSDDRAQATMEYILMLSIAVGLAAMVLKKFIIPTMTQIGSNISKSITQTLFNERIMHRIRVPR